MCWTIDEFTKVIMQIMGGSRRLDLNLEDFSCNPYLKTACNAAALSSHTFCDKNKWGKNKKAKSKVKQHICTEMIKILPNRLPNSRIKKLRCCKWIQEIQQFSTFILIRLPLNMMSMYLWNTLDKIFICKTWQQSCDIYRYTYTR